jgi:hypothetical protein
MKSPKSLDDRQAEMKERVIKRRDLRSGITTLRSADVDYFLEEWLEPGEYDATSGTPSVCAGGYGHFCRVPFSVAGHENIIIEMRLNLGNDRKPFAPRYGKFWEEWIRANGGFPGSDGLTVDVFANRKCRILVSDKTAMYSGRFWRRFSIVQTVLMWEPKVYAPIQVIEAIA